MEIRHKPGHIKHERCYFPFYSKGLKMFKRMIMEKKLTRTCDEIITTKKDTDNAILIRGGKLSGKGT